MKLFLCGGVERSCLRPVPDRLEQVMMRNAAEVKGQKDFLNDSKINDFKKKMENPFEGDLSEVIVIPIPPTAPWGRSLKINRLEGKKPNTEIPRS